MDNPYAAGQANPVVQGGGEGVISPGVHDALSRTKPWVRFMAVLLFIGSGFMLLGGVFMALGGGLLAASGAFGGSSGAELPFAGFPVVMGVVYLLMGVVYLFPALKLWGYGSRIASMEVTRAVSDLEAALEQQRAFWKFVGIMAVVMIALYLLIIVVAVGAAMVGAAAGMGA